MTTMERQTSNTVHALDGAIVSPELEAALARGVAATKDSRAMTAAERQEYVTTICRALRLNPLTNPVQFITLNGREVLYVTRTATDQLAAMHCLNRRTIRGPEIMDVCGVKIAICVVEVTLPNGRSETATATLPVADHANLFMKLETKAKRRGTLSILGLGMLAEDELETIPDSVKGVPLTITPPAYPAWQAFAADLETVTDIKSARACWEMHNAALQREADAEHQRGGELVVDKLTALGYEMTAAHGRAAIGGTLDAHLIEVYEGLVRVGRREGDDDFALAVADVVAVLRAHRDAPESVRKDAGAAGSRTLQSLGMTAADARAALTAALKPPPPPDGTDAPAAGTRGATTARGEGRTTAANTTAPAASEVRVERDDDPDGERARAFAWLTHIAACKSPEHVAGSLRKRTLEFRAQGVFAARRAAVVDEMARRLDGDRVRAEALLCGVLAGIREAA